MRDYLKLATAQRLLREYKDEKRKKKRITQSDLLKSKLSNKIIKYILKLIAKLIKKKAYSYAINKESILEAEYSLLELDNDSDDEE